MLPRIQENTSAFSERSEHLIRTGWSKRANDELGIPPQYRKKGLHIFEGHQYEVELSRESTVHGKGLFLFGPCGVGKTHLGVGLLLDWFASMLKALIPGESQQPRKTGRFLSTIDLFAQLKNGFRSKRAEAEIMAQYLNSDLLLLDDLGTQRSSDWSWHVSNALIDHRFRFSRQTIVTSNLNLGEIASTFDDRMASRLAEMCQVIKLDGPDRRLEVSSTR